jgi:hypothetical protein
MRRMVLLAMLVAASASAQDSSFTAFRVRGSMLRLPVIGHISDDWRAKTGAQLDLASNVGASEIAVSVGRVGFDPISGKPPFTGTLISLAWTRAIVQHRALGFEAGIRLTDVRMDFDDPAMVAGLRTEEEQLLSGVARGRIMVGRGYSGFVETSYGALMTSTRTPAVTFGVGLQRDGSMPGWLRDLLR